MFGSGCWYTLLPKNIDFIKWKSYLKLLFDEEILASHDDCSFMKREKVMDK